MRKSSVFVSTLFTCLLFYLNAYSQINDLSSNHNIGFSLGPTFGGPTNQFSRYLEREGFDITSAGFIFGPTSYPVKSGPRGSYSLKYTSNYKEKGEFGVELSLSELGQVVGQNRSDDGIKVGFRSYTLGIDYTFGTRLTKLSIGPVLMINDMYRIPFGSFDEIKEKISTQIALGLKGQALIYFWNTKSTYGNFGVSYLISYPIEQGPFPLNSVPGEENALDPIKLNFSYGSVFFSFGVKLN